MFYEDFVVGREFKTGARTITGTDVDLFASITWAANPLFLSDEHARQRGFPNRITPGALIISYAIGLLYQTGLFEHLTALASIDRLFFKSPTYPGDMIKVSARVVEKKETKNPERGIVKFEVVCQNLTKGTVSFDSEMTFVFLRKV
jgi:acyl dehydratase